MLNNPNEQPKPELDAHEMHICQNEECSKPNLVQPGEVVGVAGVDSVVIELYCPNCESCTRGAFSQEALEAFDRELDRGTDELLGELEKRWLDNEKEAIDRFAGALAANHILPEDF